MHWRQRQDDDAEHAHLHRLADAIGDYLDGRPEQVGFVLVTYESTEAGTARIFSNASRRSDVGALLKELGAHLEALEEGAGIDMSNVVRLHG
jgi:hypothetical protein